MIKIMLFLFLSLSIGCRIEERSSFNQEVELSATERKLCKTWRLIYSTEVDRNPDAYYPSKDTILWKLQIDNRCYFISNSDSMLFNWKFKEINQTIDVYDVKNHSSYKILELSDTTLKIAFNASFGVAERRYILFK